MITTYGFEQARKYGKVKLDKGIATLPFLIIRSSMPIMDLSKIDLHTITKMNDNINMDSRIAGLVNSGS